MSEFNFRSMNLPAVGRGFKGEMNRFAGDAAKQRAMTYAAKHEGSVVVTAPDYKLQGITPCYVVLAPGAKIPVDATVVTE